MNIIIQLGGGGLIICKVIKPFVKVNESAEGESIHTLSTTLVSVLLSTKIKTSAGNIMLRHAVAKWKKADQVLQVMKTQPMF